MVLSVDRQDVPFCQLSLAFPKLSLGRVKSVLAGPSEVWPVLSGVPLSDTITQSEATHTCSCSTTSPDYATLSMQARHCNLRRQKPLFLSAGQAISTNRATHAGQGRCRQLHGRRDADVTSIRRKTISATTPHSSVSPYPFHFTTTPINPYGDIGINFSLPVGSGTRRYHGHVFSRQPRSRR